MLGIVGFLQTVLAVIAPLIFQSVYSESVNIYDGGFVFVVTAGITFIGFLLTWGLPLPTPKDQNGNDGSNNINDADDRLAAGSSSINAGGSDGRGRKHGGGGGRGGRGGSSGVAGRRPVSPPPSYLAGEEGSQAARPLLNTSEE